MRPKLVIFDCDGVLVDTEATGNRVISSFLTRHGLTVGPDECFRLFAGGSMKDVGQEATKRGVSLPGTWIDDIYEELFDALSKGVETACHIHELLDGLSAAGIATATASNGPPDKMRITLSPSGLHSRFKDRIFSGHTHGPPKPHPAMLLQACAQAGVSPSQAVMIDDSLTGLQAAQAAGVTPIGYLGFANSRDLAGACKTLVSSMKQLQDLWEI